MSVFPLRFAVVGHPVQQSASPAMHMAALRAMGLPHLYEAIDCPTRASFERVLGLLKRGYFYGLNVTAPLKGLAVELAGASDPETLRIGAANTLKLEGGLVQASNTDVPGMVDQIREAGGKLGVALILGSGGAAKAAVEACARLGVGGGGDLAVLDQLGRALRVPVGAGVPGQASADLPVAPAVRRGGADQGLHRAPAPVGGVRGDGGSDHPGDERGADPG
jgi:shikimate 5-dehydrogenase